MKKKAIRIKLKKIVNKYDPIDLIKIGCPEDEYDPEIERILPLLSKIKNKKELLDKVYLVFVKMFDKSIAGPKNKYKKISEELFLLFFEKR